MRGLGRRRPGDRNHIERYRYVPEAVDTVENTLALPWWHWTHDQGAEGACVGFGTSMMQSILNGKRYDPWWLWNQAKLIDPWADTNPGDNEGTVVSAACETLRTQGHVKVFRGVSSEPKRKEGVKTYRWATQVDEMRAAIHQGLPISIGVTWYSNFDNPVQKGNEYWIGEGDLGSIRGGHCLCIYGASDRRQAFKLKNSWGKSYPLVYLPYTTMQTLLDDYGEACLITDR